MKKSLLSLLAVALLLASAIAVPAQAKTFKSCLELLKTHRYGIAQSAAKAKLQNSEFQIPRVSATVYNQNIKLDTDKDGVVCEVKKNSSLKANAPKPGTKCSKVGEVQAIFDRNYKCQSSKSGAKWSEPQLNTNFVYTTDSGYSYARSTYCFIDPLVPEEWVKFQTYIKNEVRTCPGPMRFLTYEMGQATPKSKLDDLTQSAEPCKARKPSGGNHIKGFEDPDRRLAHNVLGRNAVLQIIPIYSSDTATPKNSPQEDYKKYFEFIKRYVAEVSDLPVNFEIRVPDKYLSFSKPLKPYGLNHSLPSPHPTALGEIMAEVDPFIDFSGATSALVLVPSGTPQNIFEQAPLGYYQTNEAKLFGVSSQYPANEKLLSARPDFLNLSVPAWWVHELYHVGVGLDDHYGSFPKDTSNFGMGWWGLMNPSVTDLLGWEKWILDYLGDSQVLCITDTSADPSTFWLRPSSVNTRAPKLGVIRLSSTKVVVMESIRGAGLNHVLLAEEQGVLVYTVDVANSKHGHGFDLAIPKNRTYASNSFPGSTAPLKQGESVVVEGYEITVIEAGNFGDVISVRKD